MKEEENRKAIERANAYRDMMGLWAWKDFISILDWLSNQALTDLKTLGPNQGWELELGKSVGKIKLIDEIKNEVERIITSNEK